MAAPVEVAPVTAIIPCFNSEATLERAVLSVHRQTVRLAELILIDNCSSDGTVKLMLALQERLGAGWIRVVRNEANLGVSSSRNRAWNMATQPYVAFLDSDDSWHSRKIEIQYGYMSRHPAKVVTGHDWELLREGATERAVGDTLPIRARRTRQLLRKNYFVTPGIMLKRDIPERYQEGRGDMEDHLLLIELCFHYGPIDEIQLPLAYQYKTPIYEGGLGSNLWQMEKGELKNFQYLLATARISWPTAAALSVFSILKFARRLVRSRVIRLRRNVKPRFDPARPD